MSENNKNTGGADQKEQTSQPGKSNPNPNTGTPGTGQQPGKSGNEGSEDKRQGAEQTQASSNANTQK
jgi:hypothetical protein